MVLSVKDAEVMIGMVARGDDQHHIAAWFGENQGRVADALAGKYGTTKAAPENDLPPSGAPGMKGRRLRFKVTKAVEALKAGDHKAALALLEEGLANFNKNE